MSIKLKFSLLIVIFVITLVVILTYISIVGQERTILAETDKRIKTLMENASDTIKEGLVSADDLLISSVIIKMKNKDFDMKNIYLVTKTGKLLFHSDSSIMKRVLINNDRSIFAGKIYKHLLSKDKFLKRKEKNNMYLYVYNIKENNRTLGFLFVEFSANRLIKIIGTTRMRLISISVVILILFIIITYIFTGILLQPIKNFAEGAKIIGTGNLDHRIKIKRNDELGILADKFNDMTAELKVSRNKIIEQQLLEKDLHIAKEIQSFLIPEEIPKIKNVDIGRYYKPAHFVGGDYYDVIKISDHKYGIIIIDVSGKGSGAAIIMAVITFLFHSAATRTFNTADLMKKLNDKLIGRIPMGRYATGIYMIYDELKGVFQYTNAGHNNLLLYKKSSNKIYELSKAASMPIGLTTEVEFGSIAYEFHKGDILLLQTDGIYEAMNVNRKEFSLKKVKKSLLMNSEKSAKEITDNIINDVNSFIGTARQHDDMTLIILKRF